MSRRKGTEELTPEAQHELDALDAAIRGEPVVPEHAPLAELAIALREVRPRPSAGFVQALDDRAARGFRGAGGDARSGARGRGARGTRLLGRRHGVGATWRRVPHRRVAVGLGAGTALAAAVVASLVVFS